MMKKLIYKLIMSMMVCSSTMTLQGHDYNKLIHYGYATTSSLLLSYLLSIGAIQTAYYGSKTDKLKYIAATGLSTFCLGSVCHEKPRADFIKASMSAFIVGKIIRLSYLGIYNTLNAFSTSSIQSQKKYNELWQSNKISKDDNKTLLNKTLDEDVQKAEEVCKNLALISNSTPLHILAQHVFSSNIDSKKVSTLIKSMIQKNKADINKQDENGDTPLHCCLLKENSLNCQQNVTYMGYLIINGARVNIKNINGTTFWGYLKQALPINYHDFLISIFGAKTPYQKIDLQQFLEDPDFNINYQALTGEMLPNTNIPIKITLMDIAYSNRDLNLFCDLRATNKIDFSKCFYPQNSIENYFIKCA